MKRLRLAVLISGTGRTLKNLIRKIGGIRVVLSSVKDAPGLQHAAKAGIPRITVSRRDFPDTATFSTAVAKALDPHLTDLVLLAGFLHLWRFPDRYRGRVLNIHPALLPAFGGKGFHGRRVHDAVLESGARESGCTVHFADHEYDHGPILLQRRVPVLPDDTPDTLAARVFEQECIAYPEAVRRIADGRVKEAVRAR